MNRRMFLGGASAGTVAMIAGGHGLAFAQEASPEASPEATPDPRYAFVYEDSLVSARRSFSREDITAQGAATYQFTVSLYADLAAAEFAYQQRGRLLEAFFAHFHEDPDITWEVGQNVVITAPDIGARQSAGFVPATGDGIGVVVAWLFAQQGSVVHRCFAIGFGNPVEEFFGIVADHLDFDAVDPADDAAVLSLLPDVADLPTGFALDDDADPIMRPDDATPVTGATPTS